MCKCKNGVPKFIGIDVLGRFGCVGCEEFFPEEAAIEYIKVMTLNDTEEERAALIEKARNRSRFLCGNISSVLIKMLWKNRKK